MKASDVIDSYVHDTARQLPRAKRNDVAMELRSLLSEELAARAEAQGRAPDKAMALDLLKGFGRPAETAARYHQRPAIIEPADTHYFLIAVGAMGLVYLVFLVGGAGEEALDLFLEWLGLMVLVFAIKGWWSRRDARKGRLGWEPKPVKDPAAVNRAGAVGSAAAILIPFAIWWSPPTTVGLLTGWRIPTEGWAWSEAFMAGPYWKIIAVCLLGIGAAYLAEAALGRRTTASAAAHVAVGAVLGVTLLLGLAADGPLFVSTEISRVATGFIALVGIACILIAAWEGYRWWARVAPAPAPERP